jgi:NitT/TauT family transport system substrate-binding protein
MPSRRRFVSSVVAGGLVGAALPGRRAFAAPVHVNVATQIGLAYLPLHIMIHDNIWVDHAAAAGVPATFSYARFGGGSELNDALLSGAAQVTAAGIAPLITMWDRTRSNLKVTGLSALNACPLDLLGHRAGLDTIHDLTQRDRVAVASLRVSIQAVIFEMGIVKTFGKDALARYVPTEVNMAHPDATAALISGGTPITAYMSAPPFQQVALKHPGVTKLADSFQIQGGPATFSAAYTTGRFISENPKLVEAYYPALQQAIDLIARNPSGSLDKYVAMTGDKTNRKLLEGILRGQHGEFSFSPVPSRTLPIAQFMVSTRVLRTAPSSWQDYFAANLHGVAGS